MFQTVLIANRGDQPQSGAATQSKCQVGTTRHDDLATEAAHV